MNKQAITFFSLFSLILVLSVYYVMIPPLSYNTEQSAQEVSLEDQLQEKRETESESQRDILASSQSTGEELNQALEKLSKASEVTSLETKVTEALNTLGYNQVFCEVNEQIIKVTITKKDATQEDAIKVMDEVVNICKGKYRPEIKFINE